MGLVDTVADRERDGRQRADKRTAALPGAGQARASTPSVLPASDGNSPARQRPRGAESDAGASARPAGGAQTGDAGTAR